MSASLEAMKLHPEDVMKMLVCETHIGSTNSDFRGDNYIWKRRNDGIQIINLKYSWEKLLLAARAIAAVANPSDICVVSSREYVKRAVLKFAKHIGATAITERFPPGCFTNRNHQEFKEPGLLIVSDPLADHQAVKEASYCGLPVIAFTDSDSPLKFVDIAIPCNNKGKKSIALMYWFLAREVLYIKNLIPREDRNLFKKLSSNGNVEIIMPDLYFYRSAEEMKKEEEELQHKREEEPMEQTTAIDFQPAGVHEPLKLDMPAIADWAAADGWDQPKPDNVTAPPKVEEAPLDGDGSW